MQWLTFSLQAFALSRHMETVMLPCVGVRPPICKGLHVSVQTMQVLRKPT